MPNVSKFKIKYENLKKVECKDAKLSINRKKFLACGGKNSETCVIHTLKKFFIFSNYIENKQLPEFFFFE